MRQLSCSTKKISVIGKQIKTVRPAIATSVRSFSSFVEREKAAENIYFRDQETLKLAEIRAKFEKIITSDDHAQREEVMQLIGGRINIF